MKALLILLNVIFTINCHSQIDSTNINSFAHTILKYDGDLTGKDTIMLVGVNRCVAVQYKIRNGKIRQSIRSDRESGLIWIRNYNRRGKITRTKDKRTKPSECILRNIINSGSEYKLEQ